MAFQFDTSGVVEGTPHIATPDGQRYLAVGWAILSPFMQGYVRAAFSGLSKAKFPAMAEAFLSDEERAGMLVGFSDLAPATLAAMMADCELALKRAAYTPDSADGEAFWVERQRGDFPLSFPPLTLTIRDDGLVYQEART